LEEFAKKNAHLRVVTIQEDEHHFHGKKFALMVGIKGAKYEHLLLTDADCKPASKNWITSMMGNFTTEAEIVLGYGAYEKTKGLLNKLIRFDSYYIALQYLSFALSRKTYMGVGRNLSYTKSLFFKHKGFAFTTTYNREMTICLSTKLQQSRILLSTLLSIAIHFLKQKKLIKVGCFKKGGISLPLHTINLLPNGGYFFYNLVNIYFLCCCLYYYVFGINLMLFWRHLC